MRLVLATLFGIVLERLFGIEAEQTQRAVEPVDANRVAVGDLRHLELADDESRRLELEQRLLRLLSRVAIGFAGDTRDERDEHEREQAIGTARDGQGHAGLACFGVPAGVVFVHQLVGASLSFAFGGVAPLSEYVPIFGRTS
jgi:hypothetical protein